MNLLKNEVTIGAGKNPVSKALQEMGIKPTEIEWEKSKSGKSMDRYFVEGDRIRINTENQIELLRLRMETSVKIGVLKNGITHKEPTQEETGEKNDRRISINVASGDTISGILNTIFGVGKYRYGDKKGSQNMPAGWDAILTGESLKLETDGKKRKSRYLYTLSREKDGREESITFVSSKLLRGAKIGTKEPLKIEPRVEIGNTTPPIEKEKILEKPHISALMDIFPGVDHKSIAPLLQGQSIHVIAGKAGEYRLADSIIDNTAKAGKISAQFANGVIPEKSDIVLIKEVGPNYIALAYPKLEKSGRSYASSPRGT